jgi:predicted glycogen debranching enzyme
VEINALWHGALTLAADWADLLGDKTDFRDEAGRVQSSFRAKFWNARRSCLFDVLAPEGAVEKIRPNQIFAVSLPHGLLEKPQQQAIVRLVERELLTDVGLRTLDRGKARCGRGCWGLISTRISTRSAASRRLSDRLI